MSCWIDYVADRPGDDHRYWLSFAKDRVLGWEPSGIARIAGGESGNYRTYYERQYDKIIMSECRGLHKLDNYDHIEPS